MENVWENKVKDSNFKAWFINLLDEMKGEIIEELKQVIKARETPDLKKWVKSAQVKKLLDVSHGKLQMMRDQKIISFTKIGGTLYYNLEDIQKMLDENSNK